MTPKAQMMKTKNDKLNFIKIKSFCVLRTPSRNEQIPKEWKNLYLQIITSYKGPVSRLQKELRLKNKK